MIKSLYTAGKLLSQLDTCKGYFQPWANPFPNLRSEASVLVAELNNGQLAPDLTVENFDPARLDKYLFREAKANATNVVPTFYLYAQATTGKQWKSIRTMVRKIRQSIKNVNHNFIDDEQIDEIEQLLRRFPFDPAGRYLFTIKINGLYFGDMEACRALFTEDKMAYAAYWKKSSANDKVCAVGYEYVPEVWGRVSTLGFTVGKPAFSRNGFNGADSYKMFPVAPDVVRTLEGVKRLVRERLSRNFFGLTYFIMPRFLQAVSDEQAARFWTEFLLNYSADKGARNRPFPSFIDQEPIIGELVANEILNRSSIGYAIFFYEENQAQFAIKLHIADILPSRFARLLSVKTAVDRCYTGLTDGGFAGADGQAGFTVTLASIKDYFAENRLDKGRDNWVFRPYFYRIVEAIFYNQPLDREQVLRAFVAAIRASFPANDVPHQFSRDVGHTFTLLQFFYQLNLLSFSGMEPSPPQPVGLTPELFEQQHPDLLTHPLRRAAFYLGCEAAMLLAKQKRFYRSEPFRQHLNGLNLDVAQLRKIHLKLTAKIGDYTDTAVTDKRHFYAAELSRIAELDAHIGPALLLAGNTLSKADISYAFAVGMTLQKAFTHEQIRTDTLQKGNPPAVSGS
ncbi:TM1802 family CRISPR-associated protein [Spirosoma areae]